MVSQYLANLFVIELSLKSRLSEVTCGFMLNCCCNEKSDLNLVSRQKDGFKLKVLWFMYLLPCSASTGRDHYTESHISVWSELWSFRTESKQAGSLDKT